MKILLIGKSGLAKDLISSFGIENYIRKITLFDDVSAVESPKLFDFFSIITSMDDARLYFKNESSFFISAIGSPRKRKAITLQMEEIGGKNFSYFCSKSLISQHSSVSERGVIIQINCQISSGVTIEDGVFINVGCLIGHDSIIGKWTTLSPRVTILGNVTIGENCVLATGVTVMPNVIIGNNVKIGMNKLVTENIPDDTQLF